MPPKRHTLKPLFIAGPAGRLQAMHSTPAEGPATACGLICHPHPQQEGTMHNKVVTAISWAMQAMGWATLRFNYRGVMESEGEYDNQVGEIDDALAAYTFLQQNHPGLPIHVAGFSFGAFIAASVASTQAVGSLVTAAPVVQHSRYEQLAPIHASWLAAVGDADDLVSPEQIESFRATLSKPFDLEVFKETSHFFHGQLIPLREMILGFYQNLSSNE